MNSYVNFLKTLLKLRQLLKIAISVGAIDYECKRWYLPSSVSSSRIFLVSIGVGVGVTLTCLLEGGILTNVDMEPIHLTVTAFQS